MRGRSNPQRSLLATMGLEERVPRDHPLRRIKELADAALERLSPVFGRMYARVGRALCDEVVWAADGEGLLSDEHFRVDGTLIEAATSPGASGPRTNLVALVVADVIPNPFFCSLPTGGNTEIAALDMEAQHEYSANEDLQEMPAREPTGRQMLRAVWCETHVV